MGLVAQKQVKPRMSADFRNISRNRLETIQDLIDTIRQREPEQKHLLAMLTATAAHISIHLEIP